MEGKQGGKLSFRGLPDWLTEIIDYLCIINSITTIDNGLFNEFHPVSDRVRQTILLQRSPLYMA